MGFTVFERWCGGRKLLFVRARRTLTFCVGQQRSFVCNTSIVRGILNQDDVFACLNSTVLLSSWICVLMVDVHMIAFRAYDMNFMSMAVCSEARGSFWFFDFRIVRVFHRVWDDIHWRFEKRIETTMCYLNQHQDLVWTQTIVMISTLLSWQNFVSTNVKTSCSNITRILTFFTIFFSADKISRYLRSSLLEDERRNLV